MGAGKTHTVVQGEYVAKIARENGFASFLTLWNAPENAELKAKRKNPNILLPGDKIFIPEKETKVEDRATGKSHKFEFPTEKLMLRIARKDTRNQPMKDHACVLSLEADGKELTTNGEGIVEREVTEPHKVNNGLLIDRGGPQDKPRLEVSIPLRIGHLDPEDTVSGQIARLNNLGYDAGDVPENAMTEAEAKEVVSSMKFRGAVEEFQCDFGMTVDGVCGQATQARLVKEHGC